MKTYRTDVELEVIVRRIREEELDLQPEFQRGEIWDIKRRQRLIDTILRGWYVPAVHIVQEPNRPESVLDGQQRLATIRDFFDDRLSIDGHVEPLLPAVESLDGLVFSELPQAVQRRLRRFPLPVVYLTEYSPGEPNELFFRLNQSYNLTPPEKRNALHGVARNQVKDLVNEMQEWGLLQRESIGFNNQRLAYDDIVARTCVAIEQGTLRRHINNTVVEEFYREHRFHAKTIDGVRRAGRDLMRQVQDQSKVKFNKGTLQTWLTYCYWAPRVTGPLPSDLLQAFETDRQRIKNRSSGYETLQQRRVLAVVAVYDDRASYRVTDVSSVVARDLAIHLYSEEFFHTTPVMGSNHLLDRIKHDDTADPSSLMFDFIDDVRWGDRLLEGG